MDSSVPLSTSECTPLLVLSLLVSENSVESAPLFALAMFVAPARCSAARPQAASTPAVISAGRAAAARRALGCGLVVTGLLRPHRLSGSLQLVPRRRHRP